MTTTTSCSRWRRSGVIDRAHVRVAHAVHWRVWRDVPGNINFFGQAAAVC